jgi:hypothetical protein
MDGASPLASNWLRAAFESVAGRLVDRGDTLPTDALERFVLDLRHAPRARRLAYEWLARVDGTAPDRLIPRLADDPSVEFRRDAVARSVAMAERLESAGEKAAASAEYREALRSARDIDQIRAVATKLRQLGETVDIRSHFGFLPDWKLIGPFDHSGSKAFDVRYPPEIEFSQDSEYDGKGQRVRWKDFRTDDEYGVVDLNQALGRHKGAIAYALAEFPSGAARVVELRLGCVTGWKLWLNGELLFGHEEYHHGMEIDQFRVDGKLCAGQNRLLLKVCQNEQTEEFAQEWRFQVRVCDAAGTAVLLDSPTPGSDIPKVGAPAEKDPVRASTGAEAAEGDGDGGGPPR